MDGNDFYYEERTKVNVFLQDQRQITLLHQFLLPCIASGETPTQRTVTLQERCSFATSPRQTMLSSSSLVSSSHAH